MIELRGCHHELDLVVEITSLLLNSLDRDIKNKHLKACVVPV